jgi:hypothetical protein
MKNQKKDSLTNSSPFRPHLCSEHQAVSGLTEQLLSELLHDSGLKEKKRIHTTKYLKALEIILLNLYSAQLINTNRYVSFPRDSNYYSGSSRYSNKQLGYNVAIAAIDALLECGYITSKPGYIDQFTGIGFRSRIRATEKLIDLLKTHRLNRFMVTHSEDEEVIILKSGKDDRKKSDYIEYKDSKITSQMRSNLSFINRELDKRLINLHLSDDQWVKLNERMLYEEDRQPIDFSRRKLKRIFNNGNFDHGGRFYHGWWQEVPSDFRKYIEIDNMKTIEIDFSQIHISMLYQREYLPVPEGDLYLLDGLEKKRKDLKKAFNIMLNAESRDSAIRAIKSEVKLSDEISSGEIYNRIAKKHEPISQYFGSGEGVRLQFYDSVIADHIMLDLLKEGVPVLPVHDSFIVPEVDKDHLLYLMNHLPDELFRYNLSSEVAGTTELEEINKQRRLGGFEELSAAGSLFLTPEEDKEKDKYRKYYEIREEWEDFKNLSGA